MDVTEILARAWIECDPNRGGPPGSGSHADDIMGQGCDGSSSGGVVYYDTPLTGKPRWHWFIPRAEAVEKYLFERGLKIVSAGEWQPIETAPKDGTRVLLGSFAGSTYHRVGAAHWEDDPYHMGDDEEAKWVGETVGFDGWDYTHWMPLPDPPHLQR